MIHGDIKPQNMPVFKDSTGKITVKVADFGYSTIAASEGGRVFLPKSRPWNAPAHHYGGFTSFEAKKTDAYSFGMLCLWVLFGSVQIPQHCTECVAEPVSFDASIGPRISLEQLKDHDNVEHLANHFIESVPLADLNTEQRVYLKEFFSLTVPLNPESGRLIFQN